MSDASLNENDTSSNAGAGGKRNIPMDSEFSKRTCNRMYLQHATADVNFIFNQNGEGEEKVPAHKVMLATGSRVFQSMFYGNLKEEGDVTITDCRVEAFKEFLQFFYLADVTLSMDNISEVMNLVNKYDAIECFPTCERFVLHNFSMEIACWALELAIVFNRIEFRQTLLQKMMEAPIEFFATESFKSCTLDLLKVILGIQRANCNETSFFKACIDWAKEACHVKGLSPTMVHMRDQMGDCFNLIQFSAMNRREISECVTMYGNLFTKEELVEIIAILASHETPDIPMLQYFPHNTRIKFIQHNNKVCFSLSPIDSTESDFSYIEVACFKMNKDIVLGAIATQIVQPKTNTAAGQTGQFNGLMEIFIRDGPGKRIIHKQAVVLFVGALQRGRSVFVPRDLIEFDRPITLDKGQLYVIKFDFAASKWTHGQFTTKKSQKINKISMHSYTAEGNFGFISNLYFLI